MSKISEIVGDPHWNSSCAEIYSQKQTIGSKDSFYSGFPKETNQLINQEIDRPSHYDSKSGQDVIDVAEDFGIIDNAYKFNMLKYLLRGGKKRDNSELQDMKKIEVYLKRFIEKLEKEAKYEEK